MNTPDIIQTIRDRRRQIGLTQEQVAARLQTYGLAHAAQQWVSDIEQGHIRPEWGVIRYMALALETDPNTLLRWQAFLDALRNK